MSDISGQLIKDSYDYVLQCDLITGLVYRIGGSIPVNPIYSSGLTVKDSFTFSDGSENAGYVLTSDSYGNSSWEPTSSLYSTSGITSSAATLGLNINYYGVNYDGEVVLTLPSPVGNDGYNLTIKDESGNCKTHRIRLISVSGNIDGNDHVDMKINYMALHLVARNNNWWII